MRNDGHLRKILENSAKFARKALCIGLAGGMLIGSGSLIVNAATLADVFDAEQYANDYGDLKSAFGDDKEALLKHYLTYGIEEKREVSGLIDVVKYREKYPDLDAAFGDNWDAYVNHFLTYGAFEGRDSGTDFNALDYAERYADLKEAFGDDVLALYQHYQTCGKDEKREARSEKVIEAEKAAAEAAAEAAKAKNTRKETYTSDSGWTYVSEYDSNGFEVKYSYYNSDGKLMGSTEYENDSNGNPVKAWYYDGDGTLTGWSVLTYNSEGLVTRETYYNADGTVGANYYTEYIYDSAEDVWTMVTTGYNADGKKSFISERRDYVMISYISYSYFEDGSYSEFVNKYEDGNYAGYTATYYNADGKIQSVYVYGSDYKTISGVYYEEDGSRSEMVYKYDSTGAQIGYTRTYYNADGVKQSVAVYEKTSEGYYEMVEQTFFDENGDPVVVE